MSVVRQGNRDGLLLFFLEQVQILHNSGALRESPAGADPLTDEAAPKKSDSACYCSQASSGDFHNRHFAAPPRVKLAILMPDSPPFILKGMCLQRA
jgi:hypothetical protein